MLSVRKNIRLYPETVLTEIGQSFEESLRRGKLIKKLKVFLINNDLHILHIASYEGEFNNCNLSIKSNNGARFFLLSIDI